MISKLDVARGASDQLGVQLQEVPPVIDCPDELPRQVGAAEYCSDTDFTHGQRHAVQVRIDRINGAAITYSVVVGAAPLPPPRRLITGAVWISRRRSCRCRAPAASAVPAP
jgi:hypothetical protein